ncbi:ATP-binding cassette domain-containing protein [Hyphomonas sp.]|uniref:ATP-binding cassette domain-containing protein n=1 Tax=Hyphomonas sp. TaxID=87 RepID=UPI001DFF7EFD|nr:ATP-binding cassette domain-containing protein [Hyphomonas sp.]MBU3920781.1 ATP-binding cassette domain-containing protein [Alphaproteobacteria bacterium]MBU4061015.1 ATP-binding cassette domain-containing protein [Alphaproteobacteria bacterium]MBU4165871.1 ATP-binding cassette domain-containing protein [Alphaproteobacteria bacterium]
MSEGPILELEDLSWSEGRRRVIERASLTLGPGEIVGISGARGAGKNALLQLVVGLRKPGSGRILFDGKDITQTGYVHRQRLGIVSPLAPHSLNWKIQRVFREATIRDRFEEAWRRSGHAGSKQDRQLLKRQILELVGIPDDQTRTDIALSGGQRSRIDIAALLAARPRVIVLDEPFKETDAVTLGWHTRLLETLAHEFGVPVLLSDRSGEAYRLCNRVYQLTDGLLGMDAPHGPQGDVDESEVDATRIFVCYSRENQPAVQDALVAFQGAAVRPWIDIRDIRTHENWERAVEQGLRGSGAVLIVLSHAAVGSPHVQNEISFALNTRKRVYVLKIDDCELPLRLSGHNYVDGSGNARAALRAVVADIQRDILPGAPSLAD